MCVFALYYIFTPAQRQLSHLTDKMLHQQGSRASGSAAPANTEPLTELSVFILKQIYREKKKYFFWWYCFSAQVVFLAQNIFISLSGVLFSIEWYKEIVDFNFFFFSISSNECWRESFIFIKKSSMSWLQQSNFFLIYLSLYPQCLSNSVTELPSLIQFILRKLIWFSLNIP